MASRGSGTHDSVDSTSSCVRGITLMASETALSNQKKKRKISFNDKGEPDNSVDLNKWCSYLRLLARSKVSICNKDWRAIHPSLKNLLWTQIRVTYEFEDPTGAIRCKWMKQMGKYWKQFKTNLTTQYIYEEGKKRNKKGRNPCLDYKFIDEKDWEEFKKSRETAEWKEKRAIHQAKQCGLMTTHYLSRGGYRKLDEKLMEEKKEKRKNATLESGMSQEDASLSPPSPSLRHERRKRALVKKDGLSQKASQGQLEVSKRNNFLAQATNKDEHPGRAAMGVGDRLDQLKKEIDRLYQIVMHLYHKPGVPLKDINVDLKPEESITTVESIYKQ